MERINQICIEQDCSRLIKLFTHYSDKNRYEELAALFVEDAVYFRPVAPEQAIQGRQAILESFLARPADRVGRHLISNILIDVLSDKAASGSCYVTLYSGTAGHYSDKYGLQASASQFVGEYHDRFVLTDQGWKFSERRGSIIFST